MQYILGIYRNVAILWATLASLIGIEHVDVLTM